MKLLFKVFLISLVIFGAIVFNGDKASAALVDDWNELFSTSETGRVGTPENTRTRTTDDLQLHSLEENPNEWITTFREACLANDTFIRFENAMDAYSDALDSNGQQIFWLRNSPNSGAWRLAVYDLSTSYTLNMAYSITGAPRLEIASQFSNVEIWDFGINNNSGSSITCDYTVQSAPLPNQILMGRNYTSRLYQTNIDFYEYAPQDFNPDILPEQEYITPDDSNLLTPEYTYYVNESGLLSVKYLGNLPHFLSGTSLLAIDKMTSNWDAIDENLESDTVLAGSLDEQYQLPGAGYYMITISHDQQLSIPPWSEENEIDQVLMQFYWNGRSPVAGDNIGGCDGICNDQKEAHNNKIIRAIENAQFSDGGLQGLIFAPINAIALLPTLGDSCSPITFPLMGEDVSMQCIRPMVQASPFGPLYATVSVIITGLITWWVALKTFATIKGLQDPDDDKVEVLKL